MNFDFNFKNLLLGSIFSGMLISIGCIVNLSVGGIPGAVLFSFGLLSILYYGSKLFTGVAGYCHAWKDLPYMLTVLIGNIFGGLIFADIFGICRPDIVGCANTLLAGRMANCGLNSTLLGIGCGVCMSAAVHAGRDEFNKTYIPALLAVPTFILCGFYHCVADAFYYSLGIIHGGVAISWKLILAYATTVIGNYIGCNLYRFNHENR